MAGKVSYGWILAAGIAILLTVMLSVWAERDRRRKRLSKQEYKKQRLMSLATAPLNLFYEKHSQDETGPIIDISKEHSDFVEDMKSNWHAIRDEGMAITAMMQTANNDLIFRHIGKDNDAWKKMYIKWYGNIDEYMKINCPVTCSVLDRHPQVHLAMFSLLKAGGRIMPHCGPFRGAIRVHLGLSTPNDDNCFIKVADEQYSWRDGELIAFDDTYKHEVHNNTNKDRLILFMDIERQMKSPMARRINKMLINHIAPLTIIRSNRKLKKVE